MSPASHCCSLSFMDTEEDQFEDDRDLVYLIVTPAP
jgi:hypothetical protein